MTIRLNLGCGTNIAPLPFLNIDHTDLEEQYLRHLRPLTDADMQGWPAEQVQHAQWLRDDRIRFFQWDIRKGLPMFPDGSVEAAYIGQVVEHLQPIVEVPAFLAECFRVLAPGGSIRLTTPDLDALIERYRYGTLSDLENEQPAYYKGTLPEDQLAYIMYGAGGTAERYDGHQHLYVFRSLAARLEAAGFEVAPEGHRSALFLECADKGMTHSFAIEGVKP